MVIEINPEKLKRELIYVYERYLSENKNLKEMAIEKAKEMDGLWSGDFLFEQCIESAIRGLRWIYLDPQLSQKKAKEILQGLKNA